MRLRKIKTQCGRVGKGRKGINRRDWELMLQQSCVTKWHYFHEITIS
jgi:hypothetical protein